MKRELAARVDGLDNSAGPVGGGYVSEDRRDEAVQREFGETERRGGCQHGQRQARQRGCLTVDPIERVATFRHSEPPH